ncbi:MAG TPA: hypothetical protein VGQ36_18990 [Thermoanaerobaculia bacterium]|jgi:hypothetical protein|nr:hypothetical protein [Thermoanaerobaculia bacterium]
MRPLEILFLFLLAATALADPLEAPVQLAPTSAAHVEVTATAVGPLAIWIRDDGVMKAQGRYVTNTAVRGAVASFGDYALVVWTRADGAVMAVRVRPDGMTAGVVRRIGSNATGPIAIAAASDRYFVTWAGTLGEVYAAIVSDVGNPLVPAMPLTTQSPSMINEIAAAASENGFAAVWHVWSEKKVFATTAAESGVPASMTPLLVSDDGLFPDITSNGDSFFAAWTDGDFESLLARTLTLDRELGRIRSLGKGMAPRISWDGFAYTVAFARNVQPRPGFSFPVLWVTRVNVAGGVVETLASAAALLPGSWDVDARSGRVHLVRSSSDVAIQSATVREPDPRMRVLRH